MTPAESSTSLDAEQVASAIAHLSSDGFIAYPTETVWGLGACADRPRAVERLMAWKGRAENAPMSILVPSLEVALDLGCVAPESARRLALAFWPGPLTLVVPCEKSFSDAVVREDGAVGLRCSPHPIARALALAVHRAALGPLSSTSMNRSGEPPAADRAAAQELIADREIEESARPLLIAAQAGAISDDAGGEIPSSVVDCTGATPRVLRAGAIGRDRLEEIWSRGETPNQREMAR